MFYKLGFKKELWFSKSNVCHADRKDWIFRISYSNSYHLEEENYIHGLEETNLKRRVALSPVYL